MSRSEYSRADVNDTTTNVPLLGTDSTDDDTFIHDHEESRNTAEPPARQSLEEGNVNLSFEQPETRIGRAFRPTKVVVLVAVIFVLFIICVVLGVLLSKSRHRSIDNQNRTVCITEGCINTAYHIFHAMNKTVNPCDDFYEFACGGWAWKYPMPESKPFWGVYSALEEENERLVRQLLTGLPTSSETTKKAKTFYDACMDKKEINLRGAKPLLDIIEDIGGWSISQMNKTGKQWNQTQWNFTDMLTTVQRKYAVSVFFATEVDADDKQSSKNVIKVDQGGLALPRSYYLRNKTDPALVAYLKFMTKVGTLLGGDNTTEEQMKDVMRFEMSLAKIFVPPDNRSQIDLIYNKITIAELQKLCLQIPWIAFWGGLFKGITDKLNDSVEVVVYATPYLKDLSPLINRTSKKVLNNYMMWQVVSSLAPLLNDDFRDARDELTKVLTGTSKSVDLWKRCIGATDGAVGMVLGALFVEKTFEGSSKQQATEMIDAIRTSFKKNLPNLEWMDDKTRRAAEDKADAVVDMIGFPSYILDEKKLQEKYADLQFKEKEYFHNKRNSMQFHRLTNLKMLIKPVDKHKWYMTPMTVNAYYSPSRNQIVFPAGILQAPYYDKKSPKVVNFGGIGTVVGHELSHGFDNSGRMYDKFGNFGNLWWTNRSVEQYKGRSDCMVRQYSEYAYFGKKVKGKFTLGENIADNGGLKAAYSAYKEWEKKNGEEPPLPLLNMTADQTFFTAFAQNWCASIRKQYAIVRLDDDPHSPNKFRVLGSLSNLPDFAKAFKCPAGSKMNPVKKCRVW